MQLGSALTKSQRQISRLGLIDLSVGYPEVAPPEWLADLWFEESLGNLVRQFLSRFPGTGVSRFESLPSAVAIEEILISAALRFLGLPVDLLRNSFVTYSGSVALERALAVAVPPFGVVRLPTPLFDIIPGILRERGATFDWWQLSEGFFHGVPTSEVDAIVIVSPDNPSGTTADGNDLGLLAEFRLVADQSFALLSRDGTAAPMLPDVADRRGAWIMTWDTGKTFDLGGDKLGLLIAGDALRAPVQDALSLVQHTLPRRLMLLMTLVLSEAVDQGYVAWLASVRGRTASMLEELTVVPDVRVEVPEFGGFATIDLGGRDVDKVIARAAQNGLGLISTQPFLVDAPIPESSPRLRVPLIRRPETMRESLTILRSTLTGAAAH